MSKRDKRHRKKLKEVRKNVELHNEMSYYYQQYLRRIDSQKSFQLWLAEVLDEPDTVQGRDLLWSIRHYFYMIYLALTGKL